MLGLGLGMAQKASGKGGAAEVWAEFGYAGGDVAGTAIYGNEKGARPWTNNSGFNISVREIVFKNCSSASGANMQMALYSDTASAPNVLLGVTDVRQAAVGDITFTMQVPVTVANGAIVWACGKSGSTIGCSAGKGVSTQIGLADAGAFANPYGTRYSYNDGSPPSRMRGVVVP